MKTVHVIPHANSPAYCGQYIYTLREMKKENQYGTTFDGWCTVALMDSYHIDNPVEYEWCEECLESPEYALAALAEVP